MYLEPVGELRRDPVIKEWFISREISVPYLGGDKLPFTIEGIEGDLAPHEFTEAIKRFLALSVNDREIAAHYVFQVYRYFVDLVGEGEFDFTIGSPAEVWSHMDLNAIYVSRRPYGDKMIYIQIAGNCEWEQEHGFQIILRGGYELARVSEQDGHLTTVDALDLP